MAKMAVVGHDKATLTDCSEVIPTPVGLAVPSPTLAPGKVFEDIEWSVSFLRSTEVILPSFSPSAIRDSLLRKRPEFIATLALLRRYLEHCMSFQLLYVLNLIINSFAAETNHNLHFHNGSVSPFLANEHAFWPTLSSNLRSILITWNNH